MDEVAKAKLRSSPTASFSGTSVGSQHGFHLTASPPEDVCLYLRDYSIAGFMPRKKEAPQVCSFVGLTMKGNLGIVDTAAQGGLIGEAALGRLEEELKQFGLRPHKLDKQGRARGVGGQAQVVAVVEIPLGLAGVCGILEVTVVKEEVPLLLPISLLKELKAVINLEEMNLHLSAEGKQTPLVSFHTGHVGIDICNFGNHGWTLPQQAKQRGRSDEMFREKSHGVCGTVNFPAMTAPKGAKWPTSFLTHSHEPVRASREDAPGARGQEGREAGIRVQFQAGSQELESGAAAALRHDRNRRQNVSTRGTRWGIRWSLYWTFFFYGTGAQGVDLQNLLHAHAQARDRLGQAAALCGNHQGRTSVTSTQLQGAPKGDERQVRALGRAAEGSRESVLSGGVVRRMSSAVAPHESTDGTNQAREGESQATDRDGARNPQ